MPGYSKDGMPLVSVIVPVYNVEMYLARCLDSIISQSFSNWECILVDDGSSDNSGRICDDYASRDSRFTVVHKRNGGVSSARNVGIGIAIGRYVYFADSDDTLMSDCLERLSDEMINSGSVMVIGDYLIYDENGNITYRNEADNSCMITYERDEILLELYRSSHSRYQGFLWNKLFINEIIRQNNVSFDESIFYNEDRLFIFRYLSYSRGRVSQFMHPVYAYVERKTGAMGRLSSKFNEKFITDLDAYIKMKEIVHSIGTKSKELRRLSCDNIYYVSYQRLADMNRSLNGNSSVVSNLLREKVKSSLGYYYYYLSLKFNVKRCIKKIL